eukprot:6195524-Pleurochrysis_carterae.AAC.2
MLVRSRVRGSEIKLSQDCLGMLQCAQVCSELVCHQHCCAKCCYPTASMPGRTTDGQEMCILCLVAKAKHGGAVLLESGAAKWFS